MILLNEYTFHKQEHEMTLIFFYYSSLNRSAKFYLEQDLKEKFQAQNIDNSCALMTMQTIPNMQLSKKNITMLSR